MDENIIPGRKPILEAIQRKASLEAVYIASHIRGELEKDMRRACKVNNIPYKVVPKSFFGKYQKYNHQGVIAFKSFTEYLSVEQILSEQKPKNEHWLFVVLEGVTDVRNLGAIARSAEIFGVDALILPSKNIAPVNADSLKTSAGAISLLNIGREKNVASALRILKEKDFLIYGTHLSATLKPEEIKSKHDIAIVMGSEDHGLSSETKKLIDEGIMIPQYGQTDSLNVSVATGVCLYEIMKLRAL